MDQIIISKAGEIISKKRQNCVLALIDFDGYPTASTITVSKADGIKWLTFCTGINKPKRIYLNNRASVCFISENPLYNISLVGKIEVITDLETKKEMWYDGLENHFQSPEDPNYYVLKFTTGRYNLFVDFQELKGKF